MSRFRREADSTLFGNKRIDVVVFVVLLLGLLAASRHLEVYSKMPAAAQTGEATGGRPIAASLNWGSR